jgi:hypothetical protein
MRTVIAIVLSLSAAISGARAGAGHIVGHGAYSCGEWTADHRKEDVASLADDVWLAGYLSAYSVYGDDNGIALPDSKGRVAWVSNYCRNHPLDHIHEAGDQLILELKAAGGLLIVAGSIRR